MPASLANLLRNLKKNPLLPAWWQDATPETKAEIAGEHARQPIVRAERAFGRGTAATAGAVYAHTPLKPAWERGGAPITDKLMRLAMTGSNMAIGGIIGAAQGGQMWRDSGFKGAAPWAFAKAFSSGMWQGFKRTWTAPSFLDAPTLREALEIATPEFVRDHPYGTFFIDMAGNLFLDPTQAAKLGAGKVLLGGTMRGRKIKGLIELGHLDDLMTLVKSKANATGTGEAIRIHNKLRIARNEIRAKINGAVGVYRDAMSGSEAPDKIAEELAKGAKNLGGEVDVSFVIRPGMRDRRQAVQAARAEARTALKLRRQAAAAEGAAAKDIGASPAAAQQALSGKLAGEAAKLDRQRDALQPKLTDALDRDLDPFGEESARAAERGRRIEAIKKELAGQGERRRVLKFQLQRAVRAGNEAEGEKRAVLRAAEDEVAGLVPPRSKADLQKSYARLTRAEMARQHQINLANQAASELDRMDQAASALRAEADELVAQNKSSRSLLKLSQKARQDADDIRATQDALAQRADKLNFVSDAIHRDSMEGPAKSGLSQYWPGLRQQVEEHHAAWDPIKQYLDRLTIDAEAGVKGAQKKLEEFKGELGLYNRDLRVKLEAQAGVMERRMAKLRQQIGTGGAPQELIGDLQNMQGEYADLKRSITSLRGMERALPPGKLRNVHELPLKWDENGVKLTGPLTPQNLQVLMADAVESMSPTGLSHTPSEAQREIEAILDAAGVNKDRFYEAVDAGRGLATKYQDYLVRVGAITPDEVANARATGGYLPRVMGLYDPTQHDRILRELRTMADNGDKEASELFSTIQSSWRRSEGMSRNLPEGARTGVYSSRVETPWKERRLLFPFEDLKSRLLAMSRRIEEAGWLEYYGRIADDPELFSKVEKPGWVRVPGFEVNERVRSLEAAGRYEEADALMDEARSMGRLTGGWVHPAVSQAILPEGFMQILRRAKGEGGGPLAVAAKAVTGHTQQWIAPAHGRVAPLGGPLGRAFSVIKRANTLWSMPGQVANAASNVAAGYLATGRLDLLYRVARGIRQDISRGDLYQVMVDLMPGLGESRVSKELAQAADSMGYAEKQDLLRRIAKGLDDIAQTGWRANEGGLKLGLADAMMASATKAGLHKDESMLREIARMADEIGIDYGDVPWGIERMRSGRSALSLLFPFPTYAYKMAPLLARWGVETPWRFAKVGRAVQGLENLPVGEGGQPVYTPAEKEAVRRLTTSSRREALPWIVPYRPDSGRVFTFGFGRWTPLGLAPGQISALGVAPAVHALEGTTRFGKALVTPGESGLLSLARIGGDFLSNMAVPAYSANRIIDAWRGPRYTTEQSTQPRIPPLTFGQSLFSMLGLSPATVDPGGAADRWQTLLNQWQGMSEADKAAESAKIEQDYQTLRKFDLNIPESQISDPWKTAQPPAAPAAPAPAPPKPKPEDERSGANLPSWWKD